MIALAEITAVILAGGLGTRLRGVVADRPKVLAEVNGRPFITYLLDRLVDAGIGRVVLCTGYKAEMVKSVLKDRYRGIELIYSEEDFPLGTGGALRRALPLFGGSPLLVMNGDSFCSVDLSLFLQQHEISGAKASLTLVSVADIGRYGTVEVSPDSSVVSFEEKGARNGYGLINAGVYLLDNSVIEMLPIEKVASLELDLFPRLIGQGLYGFTHPAEFIDIGVAADYYAAADFFSGLV